MKFVSNIALATVLATAGMTPLLAAPAHAAAKQDEDAKPKVELSKPFRKQAVAIQNALKSKDYATAKTHLQTMQPLAKSEDEKYYYNSLKLSTLASSQAGDDALQPVLKTLVGNAKTPAADKGKYNFFLAQMALNNKNDDAALTYLKQAKALGYQDPQMSLLMARAAMDAGKSKEGLAALDEAITAREKAGKTVPEAQYKVAWSQAYKSGDTATMTKWLERWLTAYPTQENWRQGLQVFRSSFQKQNTKLSQDTELDLFRLMRATGALASEGDYFDYGSITNAIGLPYETKTVIDEGRSAGKISSSDSSFNDLYKSATTSIKRDDPLPTLKTQAMASSKGDLAEQTGDAFLADDKPADAIDLYQAALQKGGVQPNVVNTRLGIALTKAGNADAAKTAFAKVNGGPRGTIADLWQVWLDSQSGGSAPATATAPAAPAATPTDG